MPRFCAVYGCSNNNKKNPEKKFYGFPGVRDNRGRDIPEGINRRKLWVKALRRADFTAAKIRCASVCSDHFLSGKPAELGDVNHPDYVPSQKLGYVIARKASVAALERHKRAKKSLIPFTEDLMANLEPDHTTEGPINSEVEPQTQAEVTLDNLVEQLDKLYISQATQTEVEEKDIILHEELYRLRTCVLNLRYDKKSFENDDVKTLYFTGLPTFSALNSIFTRLIETYLKITPTSAIKDKFTLLLITLIKLRLNFDFKFLGYMFQVSPQTISRIFYSTLSILYQRLKSLIIWPARENLIKSMPECFKKHFGDKVCVIIDCFKIRVEKSKNLSAQCTTWSQYKHYSTVKVLIGITPQGSISFISQGYGGRISDKMLTEDCGILDKLIPGDVVLADRGFLIEESVGLRMAKVITPAFLNGKKQLSPEEIQSTRNVAAVRIHVERVIGVLRQKYTILYDVIPMFLAKKNLEDVGVIDQILTVCSALVNLCPSVIQSEI